MPRIKDWSVQKRVGGFERADHWLGAGERQLDQLFVWVQQRRAEKHQV